MPERLSISLRTIPHRLREQNPPECCTHRRVHPGVDCFPRNLAMHVKKILVALTMLAMIGSAQTPIAGDTPFCMSYAANLTDGDSVINITNTGANGTPLNGP